MEEYKKDGHNSIFHIKADCNNIPKEKECLLKTILDY